MKAKQGLVISCLVIALVAGLTLQVSAAGEELFKAVEQGDTDEIKDLTTGFFDVDVNSANERGGTALMLATLTENVEAVDILLSEGAKVNAKSKKGATALMLAAGKGNVELVKLLIEHGANVDATSEQGWKALDLAKYFNHHQVEEILKKHN